MKNKSSRLLALLLTALAVATTGCSKEPAATTVAVIQPTTTVTPAPVAAPVEPVVTVSPAVMTPPFAEMDAALDRATFEQHEGLSAVEQRMAREIDVQVTALKATANVSLAAGEKLDTAKEDFAEKLRMLTLATVETWTSSKHDTELSLQSVRSAFAEVMKSPPKK